MKTLNCLDQFILMAGIIISILCAALLLLGCDSIKPYIPDAPVPVIPTPEPKAECSCDSSKPLCEPDKGEECPLPFGMDIRLLAWSPSRGDWIFIGHPAGSLTLSGKMLTGNCFTKDGKAYHYKGQRQKSSSATMITDRAAEVKQTHRVYWECRK